MTLVNWPPAERFANSSISFGRLDEKYRTVFVLRDVEGFSVKETADLLGLSEANVKVRLLRARLALRDCSLKLSATTPLAFAHTPIITAGSGGSVMTESQPPAMSCEEILRALNDYVDGETLSAICREFATHHGRVQPCQIRGGQYPNTIRLYKDGEPYPCRRNCRPACGMPFAASGRAFPQAGT